MTITGTALVLFFWLYYSLQLKFVPTNSHSFSGEVGSEP